MLDHFYELLHLITRWVHFIAGIMWVGNSMLFNWIDRNLEKPENAKKGMVGKIWMVHSGGFYEMDKLFLEPAGMPKTLHWFKWQNGATWLSGISLLILLYYFSAESMMVDPTVADISGTTAIAISAISLPVAFLMYDRIWRSPIGKQFSSVATLLSIVVVVAAGAIYFSYLSGRAAYIHIGVLLGTMMTGNVWFCILPSQRELISATQEGREQDPAVGYQAKERSVHNNYMTFPLLFIMISGHFPSTFGNEQAALVLVVLAVTSAAIRHFMNIRFTTPRWWYPALAVFVGGAGTALALMADPDMFKDDGKIDREIAFAEVAEIMHNRCTPCHSQTPTNDLYKVAPNGVMFDTADQITRQSATIEERVVKLKNMPLANITNMTDEERAVLAAWIEQGAKGPE